MPMETFSTINSRRILTSEHSLLSGGSRRKFAGADDIYRCEPKFSYPGNSESSCRIGRNFFAHARAKLEWKHPDERRDDSANVRWCSTKLKFLRHEHSESRERMHVHRS